ncbi:putative membrane protein/domain protein [Nostoc sp. PCC 7524]|uniref:RDD family protein n=1 Tax=Nostoc sp. (strain ATCC 29411 / PCC 7524) TaxID=28072 RepID=UPI00029F3CE4|nr:RDD family protein [Nostoc sp. PCC 7524]AFY46487.1 putative membrane protein/domain protein [Nostoc sp. PCC 7524]
MHLFNRVKYHTPESVELEFTLAGIGNRAWALLIDYLALAAILVIFLIAWIIIAGQLSDFWQQVFGSTVGLWLIAITFIVSFVIYAGYFVFFETLWQGQTPGKRAANIRVVRDDGRPIGLQQATLRALLRPFDEFLFIGACLIIFSRQEKRLGDLAAGTIVIQAEIPTTSANFIISEQAKSFYEELSQITDLSILLPDDFAVISEYLKRRSAMSHKARNALALKLAQQLQAILNIQQLPEKVSPDVLLEAVYLAYRNREWGVGSGE